MVLVEVEAPVPAAGHEEVAVLREMPRQPHGRLVGLFAEVCEAGVRVLRPHVVRAELGLEGRHHQLGVNFTIERTQSWRGGVW